MDQITNYIFNNVGNLIASLFFCLLGVILSWTFTPKKKESSLIQNNTSFQQVVILVQQVLITYPAREVESNKKAWTRQLTTSSSSGDNSLVFIVIFAGLIIYTTYHSILIQCLIVFAITCLLSIFTISYKLHRDKQFDKLNKRWIYLMLFVITVDFFTIFFMSSQDIITGDISLLAKMLYYALGFFMMMIPNVFLFTLLVHLFAVNTFISTGGKISLFFIKHTAIFVEKSISMIIVIIVFSIISLLLSSGIAFEYIIQINNTGVDRLLGELGSR